MKADTQFIDSELDDTSIMPSFKMKFAWMKCASQGEIFILREYFDIAKPVFFRKLYELYGRRSLYAMGLHRREVTKLQRGEHPNPTHQNGKGLCTHHCQPLFLSGPKKMIDADEDLILRWKEKVNRPYNLLLTNRLNEAILHEMIRYINPGSINMKAGEWRMIVLPMPNTRVLLADAPDVWSALKKSNRDFLNRPGIHYPPNMPHEASEQLIENGYTHLHEVNTYLDRCIKNIVQAMEKMDSKDFSRPLQDMWKGVQEMNVLESSSGPFPSVKKEKDRVVRRPHSNIVITNGKR